MAVGEQTLNNNPYSTRVFGEEEGAPLVPEPERRQTSARQSIEKLRDSHDLMMSLKNKGDLMEQYQEAVDIIDRIIQKYPDAWSTTVLSDEEVMMFLQGKKFHSLESLTPQVRDLSTIIQHIAANMTSNIQVAHYRENRIKKTQSA